MTADSDRSVTTHVERSRERVRVEKERVTEQRRAYDQFRRELDSVAAAVAGRGSGATGAGGLSVQSTVRGAEPGADGCRQVREAFAETVRPHSVADVGRAEPLLETVREELGDGVAVALAPGTDTGLTPQVKRAVEASAEDREQRLAAMERALDREEESLGDAGETVESVTDWLVEADETPLSALGFEGLRERHAALAGRTEECEMLLEERQELLGSTTSQEASVGLAHDSLVEYLYEDLSATYPVLATATRLVDVLSDCQRTVRDHLVRRV